jgi:hypothetical protein
VLEPYESADTADTADVVPTPWASPHFPTVPFSSVILPRSHALNPILRMQLQWPMYTLFQCFVVAIALISPFLVTSRSPPGKWERKYRRQALTQVALTLATVAAIVLALEDLIENLDVADTVLFASLILLPVLLLWPIGPDRVGRLRWQSIRFGIFLTLCVMLSWEEGGIGYTSPLFVANTIEENRLVAEHTSIFWAAISAAYLGFTTLRITAHPK